MDDQLIALIDLLGFSSIVEKQGNVRHEGILNLLTSFANERGDSSTEIKIINATTQELSVLPAFSAFSDHIVFSFTADQLKQYGTNYVFVLANTAAWIFSRAIRLGCLVRGGIAYGPLHHQDGVVFGSALIEANKLESQFAKWPRIIISASAVEKLGYHYLFNQDDDGFTSLNYVRAAYDLEMVAGEPSAARALATRNWIAEISALCNDQINLLEKMQNLPGLQKWRWFLRRFESCFVPTTSGLLAMGQSQPLNTSSAGLGHKQ